MTLQAWQCRVRVVVPLVPVNTKLISNKTVSEIGVDSNQILVL